MQPPYMHSNPLSKQKQNRLSHDENFVHGITYDPIEGPYTLLERE